MMDTRKDGGQAFPQPVTVGPNYDMYQAFPGMSLRDWFAGQAPSHRVDFPNAEIAAAFAGVPEPEEGDIDGAARLSAAVQARLAFIYADAMLAERSK